MADKDPCDMMRGPARQYCERGNSGGSPDVSGPDKLGGFMDPLGSLANWLTDQAAALYRQMDGLMMSAASPLNGKADQIAGVYNPVAGVSLLIGSIVLVGGLIFWMARPSGPAFRKAGQAGGRFLGLIVLATAAPGVVALVAFGLGQFSVLFYADLADHPFKGMEASLLGSDSDPYGRLAQALVAVLSIGPLWLLCTLSPLALAVAMVFLPLVAGVGVSRGWLQSKTLRLLLHLVGAVLLAPVPVSIVLMLRPLLPKGALTDLLLTASTAVVCLYVLLKLPAMAKKTVASITRMPKVKASTDGQTAVTKMPEDQERKVHAKKLADIHTPGKRPWHRQQEAGGKPRRNKPPKPKETTYTVTRPITMAEERSKRVRVADLPARPAVRDADPQTPAGRR